MAVIDACVVTDGSEVMAEVVVVVWGGRRTRVRVAVVDACVVTDGSEVIAEDSRAQEMRWTSRAPPVPQIARTVSVEVKQQLKRKAEFRRWTDVLGSLCPSVILKVSVDVKQQRTNTGSPQSSGTVRWQTQVRCGVGRRKEKSRAQRLNGRHGLILSLLIVRAVPVGPKRHLKGKLKEESIAAALRRSSTQATY